MPDIGNPDYFGQSVYSRIGPSHFFAHELLVPPLPQTYDATIVSAKADIPYISVRIIDAVALDLLQFDVLVDSIRYYGVTMDFNKPRKWRNTYENLFELVECDYVNMQMLLSLKKYLHIDDSLRMIFYHSMAHSLDVHISGIYNPVE